MRLADFIRENHQKILAEWVGFARTLGPWTKDLSERELEDHAGELLTALVVDMQSDQSHREQAEKGKGHADEGVLGHVGRMHASDRLESGVNLNQLVSEYRALRASVLRL